jgi:pimeloyl-ACP methyl ester carboxylesterase
MRCIRVALLGPSEGGRMAMLFAATYPQRTRALASTVPMRTSPPENLDAFVHNTEQTWGTAEMLRAFALY